MSLSDHMTDAAIAKVASGTTYAGAATTVTSWLTLNNVGVVIGILVALAGYVTNAYYRRRDHELTARLALEDSARRAELHAARLAHIRASGPHATVDEDD
jgi:hypothetical protein